MKKRMILTLAGVLTAFAALTASASACVFFGYQPRLPKSLR